MLPIVIIKTGDSIPSLVATRGDFEDWITAGLQAEATTSIDVIPVHRAAPLPELTDVGGIVVTGSHAMVTDQLEWMLALEEWLRCAVAQEVPVLGICFGHQILAHALGGKVGYMAGGPEYGTVELNLKAAASSDPLFADLPPTFDIQTSHFQAVSEMPAGAELLGSTAQDSHSAFRYGRCAWGVQFHPEYDADITRAYAEEICRGLSKKQPDAQMPECRESDTGRKLLARFAGLVTTGT